jgi:CRISPR/Cas system-associated endonuclease/helicase Cas3
MNVYLKMLAPVTVLGALIHDLGKTCVSFQEKLAGKLGYEPIRHETMSFLIGTLIFREISTFQSPEAMRDWCGENLTRLLRRFLRISPYPDYVLDYVSQQVNARLTAEHWSVENVGLTSALWLALSHHRLPEGADSNGLIEAPWITFKQSESYFVRQRGEHQEDATTTADVEMNLTLPSSTCAAGGLPWNNLEWCQAVLGAYREIGLAQRQLRRRSKAFNILDEVNPYTQGLAFMARPALVFADYLDSSQKKASTTDRDNGEIYANTIDGMFADRLDEHLLHTGAYAAEYFRKMFINKRTLMDKTPSLSRTSRARQMKGVKFTSSDPRYQWQNKIGEQLAHQASDQPFFGCVIGKTGSGKTRGNVLTMHAMKKSLRFTCAIGLRALVQQTFAAYQETFIGLDQSNVALLIGEKSFAKPDPQGVKLSQNNGYDPLIPQGSGNDAGLDISALGEGYELFSTSRKKHELDFLFDAKKQAKLITTPVQVLTIDHLTSGASLDVASGLKQLFHLMSTDLVIDEVDDYDPKSLPAISRMAFISGFFGRSFVVSSATASRVIVDALFHAWYKGIKKRQFMKVGVIPRAVLISHVPGFETRLVKPKDFDAQLTVFMRGVDRHSRSAEQRKHAVKIVQITPAVYTQAQLRFKKTSKFLNDAQCLEIFEKAIKPLHDMPHIGVERDGIKLSSGFIRFTHIKTAQHYAAWLNAQQFEDTLVIPFCYHSKMIAAERRAIEEILVQINTRKAKGDVSGDDAIYQHTFIQNILKIAKEHGIRNVQLILNTTSIIEVGRDHDYDYALLEPSSTRSMVQAAGRVWRHRDKQLPEGAFNAMILSGPVKYLTRCDSDDVWRFPGIEDSNEEKNIPGVSLYRFCDLESPNFKLKRMAHLLHDLGVIVKRPLKAFKWANDHLMKTVDLWCDDFVSRNRDIAHVHAGQCFGVPEEGKQTVYVKSVMSSAELANQAMNLTGIPRLSSDRRFNWPHGLHYAQCNMAVLNANHPTKRLLREADENVTLHPDDEDTKAAGELVDHWRVMVQRTAKGKTNFSDIALPIEHVSFGPLWIPANLIDLMNQYGMESTQMAGALTIRQSEFEKILVADEMTAAYVPGLGLVLHPEVLTHLIKTTASTTS